MSDVERLEAELASLAPYFSRGAGWVCDGETILSGGRVLALLQEKTVQIQQLRDTLSRLIQTCHQDPLVEDWLSDQLDEAHRVLENYG